MENYLSALNSQIFFQDQDTQGSVRWYIKWYREHAEYKRCWFRWWGGLTLVTSISLPFLLSIVAEQEKAFIAACGAWIIALASGLNSFFQFSKAWQQYIETQYRLEHLLTAWELDKASLPAVPTAEDLAKFHQATQLFVDQARAAVIDETKSYFEEVKFPNISQSKTAA